MGLSAQTLKSSKHPSDEVAQAGASLGATPYVVLFRGTVDKDGNLTRAVKKANKDSSVVHGQTSGALQMEAVRRSAGRGKPSCVPEGGLHSV
mmetsp:Transcript_62873/g.148927  ORF Transcript_62873/g.148927 Transcript_62873/m.148927 type:complete len:92 (+) Transcript_62873:354-629(+)|eukprot:CAMPEP_0175948840 /NCGR_PEP_ID=MMETSP0108-20121206/28692_1 /TAXON_ID=195067 ORGANISM="Goniomonas pacifica, Strain CCMP1869" /NCGR_SAMPLE_ID=MMETSP0108 /ASSEMBLY_ACC=CAM_ASM_000204 /LENGTH=91 /DNA_ID=CAMNT_0017274681 /DNA_START=2253 /DNA_END=2528 /DNA_ORIENTATION=-